MKTEKTKAVASAFSGPLLRVLMVTYLADH